MGRLKNKYYEFRDKIRYRKIKKANLPYPFYDKRRETFEWVFYDRGIIDGRYFYNVSSNLHYALEDITASGVTYHYIIDNKHPKKVKIFDDDNFISKEVYHSHNFEEVLRALYDYPEYFYIPDEFKDNYSKQELRFLNNIQKYLQFIGLKDYKPSNERNILRKKFDKIFSKPKENLIDKIKIKYYDKLERKIIEKEYYERYHNSKYEKYKDYYFITLDKENVDLIINNKKDYIIHYSPYIKENDNFSTVNEKYLLKDKDSNIYALIEITKNEKMQFKDLDKTKAYCLEYFKNFEEYKDYLRDKYKKINRDFNDNSLIIYEQIKVLEVFNNSKKDSNL